MFFVYLLKSQKDGNYYIGQTSDLDQRLIEHNSGFVQSTKYRTPFDMIGFEKYSTRDEARWREYSLKKSAQQRRKFISKFIPG